MEADRTYSRQFICHEMKTAIISTHFSFKASLLRTTDGQKEVYHIIVFPIPFFGSLHYLVIRNLVPI